MDIGSSVKRIRKQRARTIREVAEETNLTRSLISQIENNKANPSLKSLMAIAQALGVTIGSFFDEDHAKSSPVVRAKERKTIRTGNGISFYLLTPTLLNSPVEFLYCIYEPGASTSPPHAHRGTECGIVLAGRMEVTIEDKQHILEKGDSIIFSSERSHFATNIHSGRTTTIWVNTPPTY
jgi:transcriptional regulator with XRE-family HTH domain